VSHVSYSLNLQTEHETRDTLQVSTEMKRALIIHIIVIADHNIGAVDVAVDVDGGVGLSGLGWFFRCRLLDDRRRTIH